jgi:hypothetical protein
MLKEGKVKTHRMIRSPAFKSNNIGRRMLAEANIRMRQGE